MRLRHAIVAAIAVLILAPLAFLHGLLRASLPPLDGAIPAAGLAAPVSLERDHLGAVTITAENRIDLAFATGFAHGQDRFFEMDLSRRLAAGELAELFGPAALEQDQKARLFHFRRVARQVIETATPRERAIVEAYTRGVNAGLASLRSRPWEYWVLGAPPVAWRPEDSILVMHAMWWTLQANGLVREILRREINERIGGQVCDAGWKCGLRFFYPARNEWDAPINGASLSAGTAGLVPPAGGVPGPDVLNVRGVSASPASDKPAKQPGKKPGGHAEQARLFGSPDPAVGSNNWALAGRLTTTGAALVASDMHLGQSVPTIWYHARLRTRGTADEPALDMTGVTLPGAPLLVAGSNGHIAWAFTNSYGDWLNVTAVPCTSVGLAELTTPSGVVPLTVEHEEIRVKGGPLVVAEVKSGPDGVLLRAEPERRLCWFGSWLATVPAASNLHLIDLERVTSAAGALDVAPRIGIPHQNLVVGDREGHIGWTIYGRIPTDIGAERASGHSPWTTVDDHPRIFDPDSGRIWTANARVTNDERQEAAIGGDLAALGSEYDLGARAQQIRDDLQALKGPATPADMLRVQLDDRAIFLTRWRDFLVQLLDTDAIRDHPQRAKFKLLLASWQGRATTDSVAYRLVATYHRHLERAVWDMIGGALRIPSEDSPVLPSQFEVPLWQLVHEQPLHMLAADFPSWRDFLLAQVDAVGSALEQQCGSLERCTWGLRRAVHIQHPISRGLPLLAPLLDMPVVELPGDHDMPRVQDGAFGASERFAVSPGHEDQGYFHMPGGQSGHPLSPYYRAGFMQWARGQPLPFLPGAAEHTLTLEPGKL